MLRRFFSSKAALLLLFGGVLLMAALTHGYNMFHFPYYENDEGAYLSQAWSLIKFGTLAPYTYWYDHAPAGWMFIAVWTLFTGGFFTFGTSVDSGRVFMLVIHVLSTLLLLLISKRLTRSYAAGIIAAFIFSLSPLGIYLQRRVLLDNLMIFWVLLSLFFLLREKFTLRNVFASAFTFGIAVLTKENAIFFFPAFVYTVYTRADRFHRRFAVIEWSAVSLLLISLYFFYALIKTELLPPGMLGSSLHRVSLLGTLEEQASRGVSLPFWNPKSEFYTNLLNWFSKDRYMMLIAISSTVLSSLLSLKIKALRIPTLFALCFWAFLMRGKLVIEFYIIPLLPLVSLLSGMLISFFTQLIGKRTYILALLRFLSVAGIIFLFLQNPLNHFRNDETTAYRNTITWIKNHLSPEDSIVIDSSMYIDLRDARFPGDPIFPNADWYWKVDYDPDVKEGKLQNNWRNISYIALSHEMLKQIKRGTQTMPKKALDNAVMLTDYWSNKRPSFRDIPSYTSTNGDWMSIYKVADDDEILLTASWAAFKKRYIHSYGQVINPETGTTTSTAQADAMLRAVWMNDETSFAGLWNWTKDHFQHRRTDALLSTTWKGDRLIASDYDIMADQEVALSLLLAYKVWGKETYRTEGLRIVEDIWPVLGKQPGNMTIVSPAVYKLFAEFDTAHPWTKIADASYPALAKQSLLTPITSSSCLDRTTGLALDSMWYTDERATSLLENEPQQTASVIDRLARLSVTDRAEAKNLYTTAFVQPFNFDTGIWKKEQSFRFNACAWLAVSLYTTRLPEYQK